MANYYNNASISSRLKHIIRLLKDINKIEEEEIFDDQNDIKMISSINTLKENLEDEIYNIFENIPTNKDGIKEYTDKFSEINSYKNIPEKYKYSCSGLFTTESHFKMLLRPFDFVQESEPESKIECDYKNIFMATPALVTNNNGYFRRYYRDEYYPVVKPDQAITHLPRNMSMMNYHYIQTILNTKRPTKSLSLVDVKNEITELLKTIDKDKTETINILTTQFENLETQYNELLTKYTATNNKINKICADNKYAIYSCDEQPETKKHVEDFKQTAEQMIKINNEIIHIGKTLNSEIKACFKLEQKLAAILSYITDQREMHYSYKERRKYTIKTDVNTHLIIDDTHKENANDQTKHITKNRQKMINAKYRHYAKYDYCNAQQIYDRTNKTNVVDIENISIYYVPDFKIPYLTKDAADMIIDKYTDSYQIEAMKINDNAKNKHNNAQNALEKSYYASLCIHDLCEDPMNNIIQTLDIDMNDILYINKTVKLSNNTSDTIAILRLLQDTSDIFPNYLHDDFKTPNIVSCYPFDTRYNYHQSNEMSIMNTVKSDIDDYNSNHKFIKNKLNDMLEIINTIQEQMSAIKDASYHNFLVKSGMLDESLIAEPKNKKTKTKNNNQNNIKTSDTIIIDGDFVEIIE